MFFTMRQRSKDEVNGHGPSAEIREQIRSRVRENEHTTLAQKCLPVGLKSTE